MKKTNLLLLLLISFSMAFSQGVGISNNGQPADASAMLDISSHDKGVLVPRLRTGERTSIANPAPGLLVYDIDTKSFWYYDQGLWKEILNSNSQVLPQGPASGDLYGSYPAPNVGKIQNLDVAFGVPFDKQVMKWDALNNKWQGLNDSLFLPYNAIFASPSSLFGITNNNLSTGATAIYGRTGAGIGIPLNGTVGVWGDNEGGAGILGSSNSGIGVNGFSFQNHGVSGFSTNSSSAGIFGSHANNGAAVMGEISTAGMSVYGKATGTSGRAGKFESTNPAHSDTTLVVKSAGLGIVSYFIRTNNTSNLPVLVISNNGTGEGIYSSSSKGTPGRFETLNPANNNNLIDCFSGGIGDGVNIKLMNSTSGGTGLVIDNQGTGVGISSITSSGSAAYFSNTYSGSFQPVLDVVNVGDDKAARFFTTKNSSAIPVITVGTNGVGRCISASLLNPASTNAAIYGSNAGAKGVEGIAELIGVQGQANSATGIGVKGIAFSTTTNSGAVTGSNVSDGIGVYGESSGTGDNSIGVKGVAGGGLNNDGIGVLGIANSTNHAAIGVKGTSWNNNLNIGSVTGINFQDGAGVYGEAQGIGYAVVGKVGLVSNGPNGPNGGAGLFQNYSSTNLRPVVDIETNGKGNSIFIQQTNNTNANPVIQVSHAGTGQFLRFTNNLGDIKTTLSSGGNLTTDGTITVKSDKGIVRNSTGTQLRVEVLTFTYNAPSGGNTFAAGGSDEFSLTFGSPFSTPPVVYVGNLVSDEGVTAITFKLVATDVTSAGCKINIHNVHFGARNLQTSSWKVIAVGAE